MQIEGESDRLADYPAGGVLEEHLHFRRVGGDHPQAMPSWDRQAGLNEFQQPGVGGAKT
jgi:hypothetical protein